MRMLPVKFSDTQLEKIKDTSGVININTSKISRAALKIGLERINALAEKDLSKAVDLVLVNDALAK